MSDEQLQTIYDDAYAASCTAAQEQGCFDEFSAALWHRAGLRAVFEAGRLEADEALGEIANWRARHGHDYDDDVGYPRRTFTADDIGEIEAFAEKARKS